MTALAVALLGFGWLLLVGLGFGRVCGRGGTAERLLWGWGLTATLVAWLGLAPGEWLRPVKLIPVVTLAAAAVWLLARRWVPLAVVTGSLDGRGGRAERWLRLLIAIQLGIAAVGILAPPTGHDALTYHLPLPAHYLRAGSLADTLDIPNATFPQGMEMLYLLTMVFEPAGRLAQAVNWSMLLVLAAVLGTLLRECGLPRPWPTAATALFLATPLVDRLAAHLTVDLPLAAFAALAALAVARRQPAAALAAAGLAAVVKYSGLILAAAVAAWALGRALRSPRRLALAALLAVALFAAITGPWLVRNWLNTGAPLFPFWRPAAATPASAIGAADQALTRIAGPLGDKAHRSGGPLERLIRFPFTATFEFSWIDNNWNYALGPWYLALVPLGLFFVSWRRLGPVVAVGLMTAAGIILTVPYGRYLLPALPAVMVVAGSGLAGLSARSTRWRTALLFVIITWCSCNLLLSFAQYIPNVRMLIEEGFDCQEFYRAKIDYWDGVDYLTDAIRRGGIEPRTARVCVVEQRVYPLPFAVVSGLQAGVPRRSLASGTAAGLADELRDRRVEFILVGRSYVSSIPDEVVWRQAEELTAAGRAARLYASPTAIVYQLTPIP